MAASTRDSAVKRVLTARVILDPKQLQQAIEQERSAGKTIVFTNGAFDLLHVGHVRCLRGAAREGDVLVVALNSDASVRRIKGPSRPVQPLQDRIELVASLRGVDYVTAFDADTCDELLELLRPDVHAKGSDYTLETLPEGRTLRRIGARLAIVGDEKNHSSSQIVQRIRQAT